MEDRDGATVTELRLRLYRPDPPAGAVDAYLHALAAVTVAVPPALSCPRRHETHRAEVLLLLLGLAAVLALVGVARTAAASASEPDAGPSPVARAYPFPDVTGTPIGRLSSDGLPSGWFRASGTRVAVSVFCSGTGLVTVRLATDTPTALACDRGGPAFAMLASSAPLGEFGIGVAAQHGVRWSLSVGALPPPEVTPSRPRA